MHKYNWLDCPKKIIGIDYIMINAVMSEYSNIENLINNIDDIIKKYKSVLKDHDIKKSDDTTFENNIKRLDPPYIMSCNYAHIDGCVKKAAFLNKLNSKYYCYFHVHINE